MAVMMWLVTRCIYAVLKNKDSIIVLLAETYTLNFYLIYLSYRSSQLGPNKLKLIAIWKRV